MDPTFTDPDEILAALAALEAEAPERLAGAATVEALDEISADVVGKTSPIAAGRRALGRVPGEQRRDLGRAINDVAIRLQAIVDVRRADLASFWYKLVASCGNSWSAAITSCMNSSMLLFCSRILALTRSPMRPLCSLPRRVRRASLVWVM